MQTFSPSRASVGQPLAVPLDSAPVRAEAQPPHPHGRLPSASHSITSPSPGQAVQGHHFRPVAGSAKSAPAAGSGSDRSCVPHPRLLRRELLLPQHLQVPPQLRALTVHVILVPRPALQEPPAYVTAAPDCRSAPGWASFVPVWGTVAVSSQTLRSLRLCPGGTALSLLCYRSPAQPRLPRQTPAPVRLPPLPQPHGAGHLCILGSWPAAHPVGWSFWAHLDHHA